MDVAAPRNDSIRSECPWENQKYDGWWIKPAEAAANAIDANLTTSHSAVVCATMAHETVDAAIDVHGLSQQDHHDHLVNVMWLRMCLDHDDLVNVMWSRMYLEIVKQLSTRASVHGQAQRMKICDLLVYMASDALRDNDTPSPRLQNMLDWAECFVSMI